MPAYKRDGFFDKDVTLEAEAPPPFFKWSKKVTPTVCKPTETKNREWKSTARKLEALFHVGCGAKFVNWPGLSLHQRVECDLKGSTSFHCARIGNKPPIQPYATLKPDNGYNKAFCHVHNHGKICHYIALVFPKAVLKTPQKKRNLGGDFKKPL